MVEREKEEASCLHLLVLGGQLGFLQPPATQKVAQVAKQEEDAVADVGDEGDVQRRLFKLLPLADTV